MNLPDKISSKMKSSSGFTLIEVLVVIAITLLLLAVAVPSYQNYARQSVLQSEAERLVSRLELTQSKARTGDQGADSADDAQGYLLNFNGIASGEYTLVRHLDKATAPYTDLIDKYTVDDSITKVNIMFLDNSIDPINPVWTNSDVDVFYYQSPRGYFSCLENLPVDRNNPDECLVEKFRIELQNSNGNSFYVYIEKGGVIYESAS